MRPAAAMTADTEEAASGVVAVTVTVAVVRALAVLVGIRRRCAERRRRRWTGGDGVTRGDATTSRIKGARGVR